MAYTPYGRYEYMDDCISLKACRRMQKIYNSKKPRHCTEECSAYKNADDIISAAAEVASRIAHEAAAGYSTDDLCVESERFMRKALEKVIYEQ